MICFDVNDKDLIELLRPSFEEVSDINEVEIALDYIAKRANYSNTTAKERVEYGREII